MGSGEGEARFLWFGLHGQALKALAPLAIPLPPSAAMHREGMIDPDDVQALVFHQAIDRLIAVARRYPDPALVLDEWLDLVVATVVAGRGGLDVLSLVGLCARATAFDAEFFAPQGIHH